MKNLFYMLILFSNFCIAQTFTYNLATPIPDDGQEICLPFNVSGLPSQIDSSFGNVITTSMISNFNFGFFSGCGLDQGIYPGKLDIYDSYLNTPFDLSNICNGDYYIVSITDPENRFLELNENNNSVAVPVQILQQKNPVGNADFSFSIAGSVATFTNLSPSNQKYIWQFGDGKWDTTYHAVHSYSDTGNFSVSLMSLNQCYSKTTKTNFITGVKSLDFFENVFITPNPVNEYIVINTFLKQPFPLTVELYNMSGQKVIILKEAKLFSNSKKILIDLKPFHLSTGFYILKLTGNSFSKYLKFIKEN